MKSRQSIAKKAFLSFYSRNEGHWLDMFPAAIEVGGRTIKLEGCLLPANVSQFAFKEDSTVFTIPELLLTETNSQREEGSVRRVPSEKLP